MKEVFFSAFSFIFLLAGENTKAQSLKIGVFDIDLMVQAMPGYHMVDSLVQIYEADSLTVELKLPGLPQELLYLGNDPDPVKQPPAKPATGNKSKTN